MVVLLIANFALIAFLIARNRQQLGLEALSRRGAIVVAQLVFQGQLVLITEVTSAFHRFDVRTIVSAWLVSIVVLLLFGGSGLFRAVRSFPSRIRWPQGIGAWDSIFIAAIVAVFATLIVVGWRYPPANGDSMVYHLPRAMQWIQNGSVAHFATHYVAQLELAPLHEFNLAHLHLFTSGTDRFDGYVQLIALAISAIGASEMARLLGAGRSGQVLAALVCVTVPSAILEATSTQNNVFAASIGLGIVLVLLTWRGQTGTVPRAVILGCGLGLAALTKGTLPILLAPSCLVLGLLVLHREWRHDGALERLVTSAIVVAACVVIVVSPFFGRNYKVFGQISGPISRWTISSDVTLRSAAANVLRSTAANFMMGNGRDGLATAVSRVALTGFEAAWTPLGIRPEDSRYSLGWDFDAFKVQDYSVRFRLEEFAGNPLTVVLMCWALAYFVVAGSRRRNDRVAALLAIGAGCGYLVFCSTMRWSVFAVRYQVPLLVVWSALIAVSFERYRAIGRAVGLAVLVACLPQLLDNHARSLLHPRYPFPTPLAAYFQDADDAAKAYGDVTAAVARSQCQNLGIANRVLGEYPLWAGLRERGWTGRIAHVGVTNESSRLADLTFRPCAEVFEVKPGYVSRDPTKPTFPFGKLGLSLDPGAVQPK